MKMKNTEKKLNSLEDLRGEFGLPKLNKQTRDKDKLKKQREDFLEHHKCVACGEKMTFIEKTNVCVCKNPKCKGIEHRRKDPATGEEKITYTLSFDRLDDKGAEIATNIFAE